MEGMMETNREAAAIFKTKDGAAQSDALVLFGVSGDLARKKIFPALYSMVKRGASTVPVIGVARSQCTCEDLRKRVTDSLRRSGGLMITRPSTVCSPCSIT
jgi:glucose-6-phosphate 1-dehydrogenase